MIPPVSLHPLASGLAAPTGLCYNPGPEAGWIGPTEPTQYKSRKPDSYVSPIGANLKSQHRFQMSEQTGCWISNRSAPPACGNLARSFPQAPIIRSRSTLRFQLAKRTYDMWLKNTSVVSADGNTFRIGVPSKLAKDWLEDRFSGLIQETLQAVTGSEVDIDFVISPSGHRPPLVAADGDFSVNGDNGRENGIQGPADGPVITPSELNVRFKFSSFVVGHNSQFAHAAAKAVAEAPGESYNPLFLYGGVGLGKTHLMHAIGHEVHDRFPRKRVVYLTSEQF